MFGAPDIVVEKANVDEYESGSTEEKVVWCLLPLSVVFFIRNL